MTKWAHTALFPGFFETFKRFVKFGKLSPFLSTALYTQDSWLKNYFIYKSATLYFQFCVVLIFVHTISEEWHFCTIYMESWEHSRWIRFLNPNWNVAVELYFYFIKNCRDGKSCFASVVRFSFVPVQFEYHVAWRNVSLIWK